MDHSYDVLLLALNDRGYRLARDLALAGLRVAWFDLATLGTRSPQDWSSPFCASLPPGINDLDRREFFQDQTLTEIPQGFCLWQGNHLLECQSPIRDHQLNVMGQTDGGRLLSEYSRTAQVPAPRETQSWSGDKKRLLEFSRFFNKAHLNFAEDVKSDNENPFSLFSPVYLSSNHYSIHRQRMRDLEVFGVTPLPCTGMELRYLSDRYVVSSPAFDTIESRSVCSFLSVSETRQLDPTFCQQVFSGAYLQPKWVWQRFNLNLQPFVSSEPLPPWMILLDCWSNPWLEENMVTLKKEDEENQWSLWCPIEKDNWNSQDYRETLISRLYKVLQEKFYQAEIDLKIPEERIVRDRGLDLDPYPIYDPAPSAIKVKAPHFLHCGPDQLLSLDLFDLYRAQKNILQEILSGENP